MSIDRSVIGETTISLLEDLDEIHEDVKLRRVLVIVELEGDDEEEGTLVHLRCSDGDATAQCGLIARAMDTALHFRGDDDEE